MMSSLTSSQLRLEEHYAFDQCTARTGLEAVHVV